MSASIPDSGNQMPNLEANPPLVRPPAKPPDTTTYIRGHLSQDRPAKAPSAPAQPEDSNGTILVTAAPSLLPAYADLHDRHPTTSHLARPPVPTLHTGHPPPKQRVDTNPSVPILSGLGQGERACNPHRISLG
eukprot:TRINITY_DN514_c0_g1_i1.p1 TRINITY_DN514_c0_g1~~TRINITY_DN514_c0_g1_i1.p1  ORF type:complete len:133 (-),score=7.67 TRINITY_DN514_c0_g1_i1:253-651(-)